MLGYVLRNLKLKRLLIILGLITILCIIQYYNREPRFPVLLWWTPFMFENEEIIDCHGAYTCLLTKDRNYLADPKLAAILFYGSNFEARDLPLPKRSTWAIFHEESPRNIALFLYQRSFQLFDFISTFSRNSHMPLTLQYLENLSIITDNQYFVGVEDKNQLLNQIAPVLYIQSDCDTPNGRDLYVSELMKYIKVDSYGACLKNKDFPEKLSGIYALDLYNEEFLKFIAKYKFVLAFENAICNDYITEKLWRPLSVGTVPIYLGSPTVEDWLPNNKSAILARNFKNPKALANYIEEINHNDDLYVSFLQHKFGKIENGRLKQQLKKGRFGLEPNQDHPIASFQCSVCQSAHEKRVNLIENSVYSCEKPLEGNSWEYHWKKGDCQSRALDKSIQNEEVYNEDHC